MNLIDAATEAQHAIEALFGDGCLEGINATAVILRLDTGDVDPGWKISHVTATHHPGQFWPLVGTYQGGKPLSGIIDDSEWSKPRGLDDDWIDELAEPNGIGPVCRHCHLLIDDHPKDHADDCEAKR